MTKFGRQNDRKNLSKDSRKKSGSGSRGNSVKSGGRKVSYGIEEKVSDSESDSDGEELSARGDTYRVPLHGPKSSSTQKSILKQKPPTI